MPICDVGHQPIEYHFRQGENYGDCPVCDVQDKVSRERNKREELEQAFDQLKDDIDQKLRDWEVDLQTARDEAMEMVREYKEAREEIGNEDLPEVTIAAMAQTADG